MKLSEKSWHAMVYKMTFTESGLPDNLCPYFWRVLFSVIIFILVGWFFLPAYIVQVIHDKIEKDKYDKWGWSEDGFFSVFAGISFVMNIALYAVISTILIWWNFNNEGVVAGFVIFCAIVVCIISVLISEKRKSIIAKRPKKELDYQYKEPKPNILIEFIKAKYNKYCPKIEWKNKP